MSQIGKQIGNRIIAKKQKKVLRDKAAMNFESANSAVILFDAAITGVAEPIKDFNKFLKKNGINTEVIGYVHHKEIPQELMLWQNFSFITRKELNWLGHPRGPLTDRLLSHAPDILVVISFDGAVPLKYLTKLSPARFKVGCFTEQENDYDFMINIGKTCTVEEFIDQVKHYISIINPIN